MNSKWNLICLILILSFVLPFLCFSQKQNDPFSLLRDKVGLGGWRFGPDEYFIIASYNCILNKRNELEFPVYYHVNGIAKEVIAGASFNWATIKKNTRFNFFISPELNLNYYWYPSYYSTNTVQRYGPFFCLGLIPEIKISSRFSTALEMKLGYGYQWAKNDDYFYYGQKKYFERGTYWRILGGLKLYYRF